MSARNVGLTDRYQPGSDNDSTVKVDLTPYPEQITRAGRRSGKRTRREVETLDYISAARRFISAAGRRVGECDEHELAALLALQHDLNDALATAVAGQRAHGKSWAMIARGTGTSREAAYQRWGK